jgi:TPR repeat protein
MLVTVQHSLNGFFPLEMIMPMPSARPNNVLDAIAAAFHHRGVWPEAHVLPEAHYQRMAVTYGYIAETPAGFVLTDLGKSESGQAIAQLLRRLAEQGDAAAQFKLGFLYNIGQGVPKDHCEAVQWIHAAAERGLPEAQYALGCHYAKGEGVARDYVLAHMWFNIAATQDDDYRPNPTAAFMRDSIAVATMTPDEVARAERFADDWKPK